MNQKKEDESGVQGPSSLWVIHCRWGQYVCFRRFWLSRGTVVVLAAHRRVSPSAMRSVLALHHVLCDLFWCEWSEVDELYAR